jgi:hypothetical protein
MAINPPGAPPGTPPAPAAPPAAAPPGAPGAKNQNAAVLDETNRALNSLINTLNNATGAQTAGKMMEMGAGIEGLGKAFGKFKGGDKAGGVGAFLGGMAGSATALLDIMISLATKIDVVGVATARATGYTDAYRGQIKEMAIATGQADSALFGLAATLEENGKAFSSLNNQMKIFPTLTREAQTELATTVVQFDRLGVGIEDTAKAYDLLTKGFGIGAGKINQEMKDFYAFSQQTGQPLRDVINDSNALGPMLARYGAQAPRVFKELSKEARLAGIATKEAFNISSMMDTFEGAADIAGKLNAQLGLRLSSTELMRVEEAERLQIIRDEFMMRRNFDDLGRREQQALAEIMKTNADTARKLFTGQMDISQLQKQRLSTEEGAKKQTEQMKKFEAALMSFQLAMTPFLDFATGLLEKLGSVTGGGAMGIMAALIGARAGGGGLLKMLKPGKDVTYHAEGSQRLDTGIVRGGPDGFYQPILPGDYTVTTPEGDVIAGTNLFGDDAPADGMQEKKGDIIKFLGTAIGGIVGHIIPIPGVGAMLGTFLGSMAGDALADTLYPAEDIAISRDGKTEKQPAGSFSVTGPGMSSFSMPQSQPQAQSQSQSQASAMAAAAGSKAIAEAVYKAVIDANKTSDKNRPTPVFTAQLNNRNMIDFVDKRQNESVGTLGHRT